MATDRIDLSDPVFDICSRLSLNPNHVAHLDLLPHRATVTAYVFREGKHVLDEIAGHPVTEKRIFDIHTWPV